MDGVPKLWFCSPLHNNRWVESGGLLNSYFCNINSVRTSQSWDVCVIACVIVKVGFFLYLRSWFKEAAVELIIGTSLRRMCVHVSCREKPHGSCLLVVGKKACGCFARGGSETSGRADGVTAPTAPGPRSPFTNTDPPFTWSSSNYWITHFFSTPNLLQSLKSRNLERIIFTLELFSVSLVVEPPYEEFWRKRHCYSYHSFRLVTV